MSSPLAITLAASAARTADGFGSAVDLGALRSCARLLLEVTAATGEDVALDVAVETSPSGAGSWRPVGAFSQVGGPTSARIAVGSLERYVRAVWAIDGDAPEVTFSITGQARAVYAGPEDVERYGLPPAALASIPASVVVDATIAATAVADAALANGYRLPLSTWGDDLRRACAHVAAGDLLTYRGANPDGTDQAVLDRARDAAKWLAHAGATSGLSPETVDASPEDVEAAHYVVSTPRRAR